MGVVARVLVLDDDADFRDVFGETLAGLDVSSRVVVASLADLKRHEVEALACDLAILDINLGPDQPSGIDACRWLLERGFARRIVFLTGHAASHPLVVEAAKFAQAAIVAKPLEPSAVVELVRERP